MRKPAYGLGALIGLVLLLLAVAGSPRADQQAPAVSKTAVFAVS